MKVTNKKKIFPYLLTVFLGVGIFLLAPNAHASWAADIIGGLIGLIIGAIGLILILVMKALVAVAQYNNFITSAAVSNGWTIVRDVCNMFFVLILLIIAFATILKIEQYNYKKWLPKLILMAILINFSKTICGLLIDFAQVVMLTFVNAFKDVAAGNLITNLGITEILTLAKSDASVGFWEIIGAYVLGLLYIIIALVVIVTMLAMLVMRIVMIWIYIVLSPAAYLLSAFPGGQTYAKQWWTEFSKNLIVGPVLAFFIWLSFVSLQTPISDSFPVTGDTQTEANQAGISTASENPTSASKASSPEVFIKFIIAIGMLIGGLKISQEIGGAAGGIAGKGMSKLSKGAAFAGGLGAGAALWAGRKSAAGAKAVGTGAAKLGGAALGGLDRTVGNWADKGTKFLSKKVNKPGLATNFANKGLVTTMATGVVNAPGNIWKKNIMAPLNKNKELNEKRRTYLEDEKTLGEEARLNFNGKSYKKDANNNFVAVDEKGQELNKKDADGNDTGEKDILTTGEPGKEKKVKSMKERNAAWYDAWRTAGSHSKGAANKEQEEAVAKEQQKMVDSGTTTDEMRRELMSSSTSASKKMALAMTLAIKAGFKDKKEVDEAKKYIGSNSIMMSKFNDTVDQNQAHLNYDLSVDDTGKHKNENDVAKFKNRIDIGKIDSTKLSPDAFKGKDNGTIRALRDFHGIDFNRVMETNYKRSKRSSDAISESLLQERKIDPTNPNKLMADDKSAKLHAKLTGKVEEAFTVNNKIDTSALKQFVGSGKAADLNKIDVKDIEKSPNSAQIKKLIAEGLDYAKLKSMHKQGDNPDLVKLMAEEMIKNGHGDTQRIKADNELSSTLPPTMRPSSIIMPGSPNFNMNP